MGPVKRLAAYYTNARNYFSYDHDVNELKKRAAATEKAISVLCVIRGQFIRKG